MKTVKDLIKELQTLDPNLKLVAYNYNWKIDELQLIKDFYIYEPKYSKHLKNSIYIDFKFDN